jgi:hypothetical protein
MEALEVTMARIKEATMATAFIFLMSAEVSHLPGE